MINVFNHLFFLNSLYGVVRDRSAITDHRDVIRIRETSDLLGIDASVTNTFTLNEPYVLMDAIRHELILHVREIESYIDGVDLIIPEALEMLLNEQNYNDYRQFCPDVSFDHAGFLRYVTPRNLTPTMVESSVLPMHQANFSVDLEALVSELSKEFDRDCNLIDRCIREMMFIFAIFENIETKGLDLFLPEDTPEDIWYKKFRSEIDAVEVMVEEAPAMLTNPHEVTVEQREAITKAAAELDVDGMEAFWAHAGNAESMKLLGITGNEAFSEDVRKMAGKAAEMLGTALKALKARFDERKKEGSKEAESIKEAIDASIGKLKGKAGEVDGALVDQLKKKLDGAGFGEMASKLTGAKSFTQLTQALDAISGEFSTKIKDMKEAEAAMAQAEAKVKEASSTPSGASDGATPEAQGQIKAQLSEASKDAKALMKSASEAIGESLKSLAALRSIKATLERIEKSAEPKVDGQEAWML
ncbi:hypothetical protein [Vibrio phage pTD1]|uniref:Uncharacterized protein n=1 Tax=Vibrio phage pTD1 TaxID=1938577 RepID=A0A1Q2U2V7_9CAUD|nr:hypothetical protein FDH33_gp084 [Vibrio phage pTD1]BAW98293.1 hypothetical protein [Vibrio phage pTD1]